MENKNERFVYILLLLILCLASFGLGFYMFKMSDAKEARPVPVNDSITLNAKPIMSGDVTVTNSYVGYAEAINQVQIIPYISGYLQEIPVKAGQFVREGELLITIEPNEYKANLTPQKLLSYKRKQLLLTIKITTTGFKSPARKLFPKLKQTMPEIIFCSRRQH